MQNTTSSAWRQALSECLSGDIASPRGKRIVERLCHVTRVPMRRPILAARERAAGYKFMAAEAAWIIGGDNRVSAIAKYARSMREFSDDGVFLSGAYGPKVVDQLPYVSEALRRDPETRQAVMTLWRERPAQSKDVPCTVAVQFIIRSGVLHVVDTMRSSDLWLGWPYDVFTFSMIARVVASSLRPVPQLGDLTVVAGSSHLYEDSWEKARRAVESATPDIVTAEVPENLGMDELVSWLWARADDGGLTA